MVNCTGEKSPYVEDSTTKRIRISELTTERGDEITEGEKGLGL